MPLRGFRCPHDPDSWATLDTCTTCPARCAPLQVARALWQDEVEDDGYHNDPKVISVTQTLGCIRKGFLTAEHEYVEEIAAMLARWVGTLVHARLEKAAGPDDQVEKTFTIDLGDGFSFSGTVDLIEPGVMADWKYTGRIPMEPRPSHEAQLRIYRALAALDVPAEVRYISSKEVEQYLIACPNDTKDLDRAIERGLLIKGALMGRIEPKDLPREGLHTAFGTKTECDYCPVRVECDAVEVSK